jgi:hypothetical protein
MSSRTWTPDALSSEARAYAGRAWRIVEAQHRVSTLKLVDTLAEQAVLEQLIEETKPTIPPECRHLDYLLATPFRYDAEYPRGSRFRRAGRTPGVLYASERTGTAAAEIAFYRLLFFAESPDTPWPDDAAEYTAFAVALSTARAIDLTRRPLVADRAVWCDPVAYGRCQGLADAARAATIALIRYESVRDPARGANLAVLACAAFAQPRPVDRQTWRIRLGSGGIQALCEHPRGSIEFDRATFAADPRLKDFRWER